MLARSIRWLIMGVIISLLLASCTQLGITEPPPPPEMDDVVEEPLDEEVEQEVIPQSTPPGVFIDGIRLVGIVGKKDIFEIESTNSLIPEPQRFGAKQQSSIDGKLAQYAKLVETFPDINFYAFYLELIDYSEVHPLNSTVPNVDAARSFEYFSSNKPQRLNLDSLQLNSYEDHARYYYKTDHHWSVHGTLAGYQQIYAMLAKNYPDISPMLAVDRIHRFSDIEFRGRWARDMAYLAVPDVFEVAVPDMPRYMILNSDGEEFKYNNSAEYLSGEYSTDIYADHYVEFHGKDIDFLEYVSENGANRNLLIIGDSFTNAIEPLLASHYRHTYCVDIRKYPDYYFSLSEFLSKYDVQDVLVLGGGEVVMYEWRWSISP